MRTHRACWPLIVLAMGCGGPSGVAPAEATVAPGHDDFCEDPSAPCPDPNRMADLAVERIMAVSAPLLPDWESEVRVVVLSTYDRDRSGAVDSWSEVDPILCRVWTSINDGYCERSNQGDTVRDAYGFAPFTFFIDKLGVDRSQREHLREKLLSCGVR